MNEAPRTIRKLGKCREIRWVEPEPGPDGGRQDIDGCVVDGVLESSQASTHVVLLVRCNPAPLKISLVIANESLREQVLNMLRNDGIGKTVGEIKSWDRPKY